MGNTALAPLEFGLSAQIVDSLRAVFAQFPSIQQVLIYGSRASGKFRSGSDIDLAVIAPTMSEQDFARLWNRLDDLPILFRLDVVDFEAIANPFLKQSIATEGLLFYEA